MGKESVQRDLMCNLPKRINNYDDVDAHKYMELLKCNCYTKDCINFYLKKFNWNYNFIYYYVMLRKFKVFN